MGLARVKSEMSEMQAELAAQKRYLLSQSQERDSTVETASNGKDAVNCVEARRRGFVGGLRWARARERETLMPVVSAWHMVVESRRAQGLLRSRLLEEEACREMALRQQKMELAVQHMEAEQQFREDVLSLRTLLAEAEARCAIALASPLILEAERLRLAGTDNAATVSGGTTAGSGNFPRTSSPGFHQGSNASTGVLDQRRMASSADSWSAAGSSPRSELTVSREESDDEGDAMFADKTI